MHLMATHCRLCFVRLHRCYDEPSGAVMDMLQAFAATRRHKNAHIPYTQNKKYFPRYLAVSGKKMLKHNFWDIKTSNILHISITFFFSFLAANVQFSSETKCQFNYKKKTSSFFPSSFFSMPRFSPSRIIIWGRQRYFLQLFSKNSGSESRTITACNVSDDVFSDSHHDTCSMACCQSEIILHIVCVLIRLLAKSLTMQMHCCTATAKCVLNPQGGSWVQVV